uniref:PiggyBac transposable element-derived protein domain-containing protein n=1 Tax=Octopus bimaculoides TaxID=37653 RepID=A0A0L8G771_OCTBM
MEIETLSVTGNIVLQLLKQGKAANKNHILVMDRYYDSVTLTKHLQQHQRTLTEVKLTNRSDSTFIYQDNIFCLVWIDHKFIHFISSCHDPSQVQVAPRRNKNGSEIQISIASLVKQYNMYMGGEDKNDQITKPYKTRRHYR